MADWIDRLKQNGYLIADGAWGTQLARGGLAAGACPELMNRERPEAVRAVAADYVEAGADVILTNTFGGSRFKLGKYGLAAASEELNRLGTELSVAAAGGRVFVFAAIGPIGEFIEPLGTAKEAEVIEAFAVQARAMAAGGAHGIVVESMSALDECRAGIRAVRDNTDLPVAATMTFEKGPGGFATMMGVRPEQAAEALEAAGADVVGANCGSGAEHMVEVAALMRPATGRPLWTKSNAGVPRLVDGRTVFSESPEQTAAHVPALLDAGANIVGGCCGTTPEHIRALAAEAAKLAPEKRLVETVAKLELT